MSREHVGQKTDQEIASEYRFELAYVQQMGDSERAQYDVVFEVAWRKRVHWALVQELEGFVKNHHPRNMGSEEFRDPCAFLRQIETSTKEIGLNLEKLTKAQTKVMVLNSQGWAMPAGVLAHRGIARGGNS